METMTIMERRMMAGAHSIFVNDRGSHCGTAASAAPGGEGKSNGCESVARAWGGRAHPLWDGTAVDNVPTLTLSLPPLGDATTTTDVIGVAMDAMTTASSRGGGGSGGSAAAAGWRKRKIFPLVSLANDKQDELHLKIYRYFRWLRNSLLLLMFSSTSSLLSSFVIVHCVQWW